MTATDSGYQLELGPLALMENDSNQPGSGFTIEALGDGATFGNGTPVVETMQSLLRDGDLTSTTRYGNRVASFQVRVRADTYQGLADGEALIAEQLDRPNSLTWRVPHGAPATVFDVVRSWSEFVFEDLSEVLRLERVFQLNFECLPDGRSEDAVTFQWSGPSVVLKPVTSVTGWAVSSGTRTATTNGGANVIQSSLDDVVFTVASPDAPLDNFLWIRSNSASVLSSPANLALTIGGTLVPDADLFSYGIGTSDKRYIVVADVSRWAGQSPTISFRIDTQASNARVYGLATTSYPNIPPGVIATVLGNEVPNGTTRGPAVPTFGIGVVDVIGTSRAPCTISFTAPTGGAWVYTAPDPAAALRERGLPENVYGVFDVAATTGAAVEVGATVMWFPEGSHHTQIGRTAPQPLALHPNGVWPQAGTGVVTTAADVAAVRYAYPADPDAAISFYDSSGAKQLVSPSPTLPMGYHGGAVSHENHVLHPGRCGFAVLDINGSPITTTVTYYPRWKHHAAR